MPEQQSRADAEGSHLRIVIAEDSPTQAAFLEHSFVRKGCSVTVARDGCEALEAVRAELPDLLVSDVIMPVMDGYALCRAVKSDPATAGVRVVLATQMTDCADILRGMAAGADDFLSKPYDAADLDSRVFNARRFEDSVGGDIVLEYRGGEHVFGGDLARHVNFMLSALEEAEKRLRLQRESEQRTNLLLNSMVEGLAVHEVIVDESGSAIDYRFLDVNSAFEALTGLKAGDVVGRTVLEVLPETEPFWIEQYGRVALTGEPVQFEHYARSFGRQYKVSAYCPEKGRFATVFTDITDRKLAEETLRRSEQNLNLSVGRVGTWNWDLVTDALEWSPRAKTMFGLPEDAKITHESFLAALHPEDRDGADAAINEALAGKTDCDMEYRAVWPDGTVRWIYDLGRAYEDATGTLVRMAGSMLDITDRKLSEEESRAMAADLVRSNAELEKFAYIASHDLQEPLRMVASYTQLLQRRYKGKLDADADEFIEYAVDGATRMQTLINELLAYSRVGTQGAPLVSTDLESVLMTVLKMLQTTLADAGAVVTHDPMPTVTCDGLQIGRVFQNLIANAAKFRTDQAPLIHIGATRSDGEWVFSVEDNGIGIEAAYFERIFVIFQRLQSRADYPGTGMGLAICYRIIERHGGRIWVESEPGKGSTFWFTLPDEKEG